MENKQQKIMNVPNILSLVRMLLVPLCIAAVLYMPDILGAQMMFKNSTAYFWLICLVPTLLFALTALTDMFDGKIARKYGLITDFGKFIDPLADKFMVFGLLIAILSSDYYAGIRGAFVWVAAIVMLRELGVTSLRLVVASRGVVVPASWWGKMKTVTQIAAIVIILMEPAFIYAFSGGLYNIVTPGAAHIASYIAMAAMAITTIGSGADYLKTLWPYISGAADKQTETADESCEEEMFQVEITEEPTEENNI